MNTTPFLILDNAQTGRARFYQNHRARQLFYSEDLHKLDAALAADFAQNLHATLRMAYEFGRDLMGLSEHSAPLVLDWWQDCRHLENDDAIIRTIETLQLPDAPRGQLISLTQTDSDTAFAQAVEDIQELIRAGTVYQINHTTRLTADFAGCPAALYLALRQRQPAPYAAFAYHPDDGHTLCLSPELFIHLDGQSLTTQPMKGTAKNPADERSRPAAMQALAEDPKNRAENAMIVDLLRNDFSKIALPHSVHVKNPFLVAAHGSVLQMTTTVTAALPAVTPFADVLAASFPCGSITGAPKRMAMQCIHDLEHGRPRGLYTGAIGYIEPAEAGYHAKLNVAIRTLVIKNSRASFGTGCGITIDSEPASEVAEMHTKAGFLHLPAACGLIETFAVTAGKPQRLHAHLTRLENSAKALGIPLPALPELPKTDAPHAMGRIILSPAGTLEISAKPIEPLQAPVNIVLFPKPLPDCAPLRRHKTDARTVYNQALDYAAQHGAFDAILMNESGFLLEGARSNLLLYIDGAWHTPALALDILPGIMRGAVLEKPALIGAAAICESELPADALKKAEKILITNSLRGILTARLIQ